MRKLLILKLCFLIALLPLKSWALTASDAAYWNMNRALSGTTQTALQNRGYVPNDPRTYSTLSAMSGSAVNIASSAAGAVAGAGAVTLAGITAPAWGSLLIFAAASTVVGYTVNLALNGLVNWLFNSNKTVDVITPGSDTNSIPGTSIGIGSVWCTNNGGGGCSSSPDAMASQAIADVLAVSGSAYINLISKTCAFSGTGSTMYTCSTVYKLKTGTNANGATIYVNLSNGAVVCPSGQYYQGSSCKAFSYATGQVATGQTIGQAAGTLTDVQKAQAVNPQLVAALANTLWQQAASQPGYAGFPYPSGNPITATEAQTWQQANPSLWPTVGDLVAQPHASNVIDTWTLPSNPASATLQPTTAPNPNATNPASANPLQNLGSDPGVGAPTLEATPTAQMILNPIMNLLPDLKSYSPTMSAGVCPRPTLDLFGHTQTMEAHCTILDNNRSTIHAAMVLAFSLLALLIILSA
ncbi:MULTISPECIES: hypothetical protein [unclassified Undibacterium]|uniref:hypothetical protein n=1 Tax=unclassified Undibacterium TaxID=2630295 RepID=UPI002AC939B7|nr:MULTISPECIES: hypothetical protein [unclassified Undibacterium]MEB0137646.1 hypothetical protein [Undibacterium sp. CCC2.1]MEB0170647.1 hypothetical protein [Undibacterium sp. CCC1.1]MEB0174588.1 hypothetical protein [Undibacterium sp. CCC3.4]MEB0213614.1 hypothetical protein [Undibacterium sp. 5I2]WPX43782.1 hypothetical protein RHM61_00665 [Undibacterium sp. CCC3.4]